MPRPRARRELVITLKRDGNANVVLNNLFKLTQLQSSFAINMVALVNGVPRTLNLASCCRATSTTRSTSSPAVRSSASKATQDREHILEGRIKALDVIDEIIALIRGSEDAARPRTG